MVTVLCNEKKIVIMKKKIAVFAFCLALGITGANAQTPDKRTDPQNPQTDTTYKYRRADSAGVIDRSEKDRTKPANPQKKNDPMMKKNQPARKDTVTRPRNPSPSRNPQ